MPSTIVSDFKPILRIRYLALHCFCIIPD
uniref:Uncharacterized protein n=1 Tax=Anguilla anguilla TaxID=7936 RepID=A0A0E9W2H8_ANGAN